MRNDNREYSQSRTAKVGWVILLALSALQTKSLTIQRPARIAGILLISSFLILLLALIILIASGALPAFSAGLQGSIAEKAPYAATFRRLNLLWTVGWIIQLLGFGLLARLLLRSGEEQLGVLAFIAILVSTILGLLHGTFHMSVETWAAQEAARTGSIPDVYEPLEVWIGSSFRIAYVLHLVALAGFGWGILRARLVAPRVGWVAIGWSIIWLVGYLVGAGAPGILFIMPAVIGVALLVEKNYTL
ncbi:MAG: hypothetical protein PVH03_00040 [Chloroflexota bacterium]|jgi:hypothetical protein